MKSNDQPPLYFSKPAEEHPPPAKKQPEQSPYLKAILSGDVQRTGRIVRMAISDRLAAIRYIRESRWRHNFFRG
ncbi:MAG: hypothetical protein FJY20_02490 [Bacteroidetes bacterium]|nr:hypothetical protein [Bacteroidota bacterium]